MLTLALALTGRLWVSLSGRDMPVFFGLHSVTLSTDPISSQHAVSGMQKDKPPNLAVFLCMLFPPSFHTCHIKCRSHDLKVKPLSPDWFVTGVEFNPSLSQLPSNWCGSPKVPVCFHFGNIVGVKLCSCCNAILRDYVSIKECGQCCEVLSFRFSLDEFLWVAVIYSFQ